ncbi:MAG: bug family protein [Clostridiales bacterium]|jgi:tripartite-type tricarboxylate transporter receptor subunit TctC|nr:bug family protein [Clostridiales bacterium]
MRKLKFVGLLAMVVLLSMALVVGCTGGQKADEGDKAKDQEQTAEKPDFPTKPITYIIPFNPGGQSDVEARRQQPLLEEALGTKINITYKAGGGGAVGWTELIHTKPDGYTIAGINIPHIILQPIARENAGYTTEQINPVAIFQGTPIGLAVLKDSPFNTLEDFINYAKENPGKITVGGSGTWSGHHIALLQLQELAGIELTYVPSSGAAPSVTQFLGGHTDALFANSNDLVTHKDKIKILALGSEERFEALSDVPTFKELGYEMTPSIDRGVAVPPGTPEEIKSILEDAFIQIMENEAVREQMIEQGFVPLKMDAKAAQEHINKKQKEYSQLLEDLGLPEEKK